MDRDLLNQPFRQIVLVKVYSQEYSRIHTQLVNLIKVYATLFFSKLSVCDALIFFFIQQGYCRVAYSIGFKDVLVRG